MVEVMVVVLFGIKFIDKNRFFFLSTIAVKFLW